VAAFVTGIAPTQDVGQLEKIIGGMGLDHDKFVVITKRERTDEHDDSFIEFAHAVETEGTNALNPAGVPRSPARCLSCRKSSDSRR